MANLPTWLSQRSAGLLLHPSSLPQGYGIGCLGQAAYQWIDFLKDSGISFGKMCPVGPTGYGDSPIRYLVPLLVIHTLSTGHLCSSLDIFNTMTFCL